MDAVERLLAVRAIEMLKARYCRLLDTKQWQTWGDLFAADAVMDVSDDVPAEVGHAIIKGRENIVASVSRLVGAAQFAHQVHAPEIELQGPRSARGVWAMQDVVVWPAATTSPLPGIKSVRGFGHYHETYQLLDPGWQITSLKLTRLFREMT